MPRRPLLVLAFAAAALCSSAFADVIEARNVSVEQGEDALTVSADFRVELNQRLEEALNHGVALYFALEFELVRPRWYWFDENAASEKRSLRLAYHSLSRQYRVSRGALHQNFPSLAEALRTLGTVRGWAVVARERLNPGESYIATLRLRLDTTQLPKPFQVSALTSRQWTLASDWAQVRFETKSAEEAAP